jgi:hypothetical protein
MKQIARLSEISVRIFAFSWCISLLEAAKEITEVTHLLLVNSLRKTASACGFNGMTVALAQSGVVIVHIHHGGTIFAIGSNLLCVSIGSTVNSEFRRRVVNSHPCSGFKNWIHDEGYVRNRLVHNRNNVSPLGSCICRLEYSEQDSFLYHIRRQLDSQFE